MRLARTFLTLFCVIFIASCNEDEGPGHKCFVNAVLSADMTVVKTADVGENENILIAQPEAVVEEKTTAFLTLKSGKAYDLTVNTGWTTDQTIIVDFGEKTVTFSEAKEKLSLTMTENPELTAQSQIPTFDLDAERLAEEFNGQRPTLDGAPNHVDTKVCGAREVSMTIVDDRENKQMKITYKVVADMWLSVEDQKYYESQEEKK